MSQYRVLKNAKTGTVLLARVKWGTGFFTKLRGLMFRRSLPEDEGLVFVYGRESKLDTSIHMFFMGFSIATVWLDKHFVVVDKVLAKPWRPAYASRLPAQYVIEANPSLLDRVNVGDQLKFDS